MSETSPVPSSHSPVKFRTSLGSKTLVRTQHSLPIPGPSLFHASCSRQAPATSKRATFPWSIWWVGWVQKRGSPASPISVAQPRYRTRRNVPGIRRGR